MVVPLTFTLGIFAVVISITMMTRMELGSTKYSFTKYLFWFITSIALVGFLIGFLVGLLL